MRFLYWLSKGSEQQHLNQTSSEGGRFMLLELVCASQEMSKAAPLWDWSLHGLRKKHQIRGGLNSSLPL